MIVGRNSVIQGRPFGDLLPLHHSNANHFLSGTVIKLFNGHNFPRKEKTTRSDQIGATFIIQIRSEQPGSSKSLHASTLTAASPLNRTMFTSRFWTPVGIFPTKETTCQIHVNCTAFPLLLSRKTHVLSS